MSGIQSVDPITAEVIRSGMETICFETATYVSRTPTTPILNQSNERNATSATLRPRSNTSRTASARN